MVAVLIQSFSNLAVRDYLELLNRQPVYLENYCFPLLYLTLLTPTLETPVPLQRLIPFPTAQFPLFAA